MSYFCIFGNKTTSLIDIWTIEHIVSGICVGSLIHKYRKTCRIEQGNYIAEITLLLLIAYLWEVIEHYLETGTAGMAIAYWFQGIEFWGNRIILDPLAMLLGQYLFFKKNHLALPARVFSVAWLFLHIVIFPHSMYLQDDLLGSPSWLCLR